MVHTDNFWRFEHLSDAQLLASLGGVLRSQRRTLTELVAHLGEVEDRRLHLKAAHSSMFAYCVARLGMSEDEACRRIELARLARRFPALFPELESGRITLSVALVLKPVLSPSNHRELLAAARGKCVRQARELVAERFPRTDVPSTIRKLPKRQALRASEPGAAGPSWSTASAPASAMSEPAVSEPSVSEPAMSEPAVSEPAVSEPAMSKPAMSEPAGPIPFASLPAGPTPFASVPARTEPPPERSTFALSSRTVELQEGSAASRVGSALPVSRSVIEPLSAQRYRIQFTADATLKRQLEQARDLLRHAHPGGDFGPIVSRALQLLIDDLLRRRFGARARRTSPRAAAAEAKHRPSPPSASRNVANAANAFESEGVANGAKPSVSECENVANVAPTPASKSIANSANTTAPENIAGSADPSASERVARPSASDSADPSASERVARPSASDSAAPSASEKVARRSASYSAAPSASEKVARRSASGSVGLSASENVPSAPAPERWTPACRSTTLQCAAPSSRSYVPRAARRAVLERDALGCSWTDADGVRCGSQAWLEMDHHQPKGKGGSSDPGNLRQLCRAHNQLAAEQSYGRNHIERALTRRRERQHPRHPPARG